VQTHIPDLVLLFFVLVLPGQNASAQTCPAGPEGLQPYKGNCLPTRLVGFLKCVEETGGNRVTITQTDGENGSSDMRIQLAGSGEGVLVSGTGNGLFNQRRINETIKRLSVQYGADALRACLDALPPGGSSGQPPERKTPKVLKPLRNAEGKPAKSNGQLPKFVPFPHKEGTIADFHGAASHRPLNDFGETFNLISDAEWEGESTCHYSGMPDAGPDGRLGFLRLEYDLRPNTKVNAIPGYGGIWTDFSFPPPTLYDISGFTRLSLELRFKKGSPKPIVSVALAAGDVEKSEGSVGYYDWDETIIPPNLVTESWSHVELDLAQFRSPDWSSRRHVLDVHRVFRLIISVKAEVGKSVSGYLDVDNIRFVP